MNNYNGKIIKEERIDNPDGSYITKEIYEDNTSCVRYWDKNKNNVKCEFYNDDHFENLEMISENKFRKDGSYISKNVYQEPTPKGYQSIIAWYDFKKRHTKKKEFFDNNFKQLSAYMLCKYNKDGSFCEKVYDYYDDEYYELQYDSTGKLVESYKYADKKFKNLLCTYKKTYNEDNSYKQEILFEQEEKENGCKYGIAYYDSNGLLQSTQYFSDKSCNELITDIKVEYNNDLSSTEYKKYYKGTYEMYQNQPIIHSELIHYNKNEQVVHSKSYSDLEFKNLLHERNIEYLKNRWEKHIITYSKPNTEDDGQLCEIQIKQNRYQYQNIKKYADVNCKNIISETVFIYNDDNSYIAKTIYFNKSKYNYIAKYAGYGIIKQVIEYSDENFKIPIEKRTYLYYPDNKKSKDILIEHLQENYSELEEHYKNGEIVRTKKCNFTGLLAFFTLYPYMITNILLPIVVGIGLIPVYQNHMQVFLL